MPVSMRTATRILRTSLRVETTAALAALLLCSFATSAAAAIPATERSVLDAIYTQTNGGAWVYNAGWEGPAGTECSWDGVTCDASGSHVVGLYFGQTYYVPTHNLTGTLPALDGLTELQVIDVGHNKLGGTLPSITGMTHLVELNVSYNQFSGALPSVAGLVSLETFDVSNNQFSGALPSIAGLGSLKEFDANSNAFSGSIPAFSGNGALTIYRVDNNALSGAIPSMTAVPQMVSFTASNNILSGTLPDFPSTILSVAVARNKLSGLIPDSLVKLPVLGYLDLQDNQFSGSIPDLKALSSLRYLFLNGNAFTGVPPALPAQGMQATICPNQLSHVISIPWDNVTGMTPWFVACPLPGQTPTTTTLAASTVTAVSGQAIVFTAQVSGHAPTGTVTFYDVGGIPSGISAAPVLCDSTPLAGSGDTRTASCTVTRNFADFKAFPGYTVRAVYYEDSQNQASTSKPVSVSVAKAQVALVPLAVHGATVGVPLVVSASMTPIAPGAGTPSGPIVMHFAGGWCTINPPAQTCTLVPNLTSDNRLYASYAGDANFAAVESMLTIDAPAKGLSTIQVSAWANPTSIHGAILTSNVVLHGQGGTMERVTLFDGGAPVCTTSLNTQSGADCTVGPLTAGPHTITGTYDGDDNNLPATSAPYVLNVFNTTPSVTAKFSPATAAPGQPVTLTVNVAPPSTFPPPRGPGGFINVLDGNVSCTIALPNNSCTFTPTGSGTQTVLLTYGGDNYYDQASAIATFTVTGGAPTTTSLTSSANPAIAGYLLDLRATVSGDSPAGTVAFTEGNTAICAVTSMTTSGNIGTAICGTALSMGSHTITATYNSADSRNASSSATLVLIVNAPGEPTSLVASANPASSIDGQATTFTATVSASSPMTGVVDFGEPNHPLCTSVPLQPNLNSGSARCIARLSGAGIHAITVTYQGDGNHAPSANLIGVTVTPQPAFNPNQYGLTGSWYNPATSGQGILFELYPDAAGPGTAILGGGFFTFTPGGGSTRQWFTLQGTVASNSGTAQIGIFAPSSNGNFDAGPTIGATQVGVAVIHFGDCTHMTLDYTIDAGSHSSGTIPLTRLGANESCSNNGDTGAANDTNYLLSGAWYNPATSGQGIFFDFSPTLTTLFGVWYTFAPAGVSGPAHPTWYTLQSNSFAPGTTTASNIPIYATNGGRFDSPATTAISQVGSATIDIACNQITLQYSFSAGDQAGSKGSTQLRPVGPMPAHCKP